MSWAREVVKERWRRKFDREDYRKAIHWLQLHFEMKRSDHGARDWYRLISKIETYIAAFS